MKLTIDYLHEEPFCLACGSTDIMFCMKLGVHKCINCNAVVDVIPDDIPLKERSKTRVKIKRMRDGDEH